MNNITTIEIFLVCAIVFFQTRIALKTFRNITKFKYLIPELKYFKIEKYQIPHKILQKFDPREILNTIDSYHRVELNDKDEFINEVSLVNPKGATNEVFSKIIIAINIYLLRNKGAVTDFNLIKDIVERNVETEDNDISQLSNVPLYLGLMGTMVGIVFGLINLSLVSDVNSEFDPKPFLSGVSLAMFASFWGLLCTVINSNLHYKNAKKQMEVSKNDFYTFIQTELLPLINQSISNSVYTLNQNLVQFNDNFSVNLSNLSIMLNKNHDALIAQERILQALESIDITEFAKANVRVLKELKVGTAELEKFSSYLTNLNYFLESTRKLSDSFEDILNKTNNFYTLADKLDNRIDDNNLLIHFLTDHFKQLEERGQIIRDSVVKVDDVIIKALQQLQDHTQIKIDSIKEITIKEEDLMTKALSENRNQFSKLSILEDLNKHISEFKISSASQVERLKTDVKDLKSSIEKTNRILEEIKSNSLLNKLNKIVFSIKKYFNKY